MEQGKEDVFGTLMLGQEAYKVSKFSNPLNVRTIIRSPGSAGPIDSIQVGWKSSFVAKILDQNALILTDSPIEHDEILEATMKWTRYFGQ
jgi:hypothetical protein